MRKIILLILFVVVGGFADDLDTLNIVSIVDSLDTLNNSVIVLISVILFYSGLFLSTFIFSSFMIKKG